MTDPVAEGRGGRPLAAAAVAAAALLVAILPLPGLSPRAHGALVVLITAAGLWITEAVPLAVTALLIPVLAVFLGVSDVRTAFAGFGDPILFLFLGTFLLTTAAFDHGLNDRLATAVLRSERVRRNLARLLGSVALLGCGISAWVNNTATTAMILPLALTAEGRVRRPLLVSTLLLAAYAPSLGGLATPVGTAPNLIGLRLLEEGTGERVPFIRWCLLFAPLAILVTAVAAAYLRWVVGRGKAGAGPGAGAPSTAVGSDPGSHRAEADDLRLAAPRARPWSRAERTLVIVFGIVIALWIVPGILLATPLRDQAWLRAWSAAIPETAAPLIGAIALFLLPSGTGRRRILEPDALGRISWSTLLLFGGGLSLGGLLFETGLARALGEAMFHAMPIRGTLGVVLAATLMGVLMSEMTSNTASASLVVPIVLSLAQAAGVEPTKPALAATAACSFGFMLPVSTPPNALVYATGKVRIGEMIRYGVLLDLFGIIAVTVWVTLFV